MNDYFTDWLAKEHRADLAREVERDRRAAPLHEKATASTGAAPPLVAPSRRRRWQDLLAHPFSHHPHLHAHVRLHPHRP